MNHNVYLPDDISTKAKEAELKLSRLLRDAVVGELERITAMAATLQDVQTHLLTLVDKEGRAYTGRITGTLIAVSEDREEVEVFLTDDERVILYHGRVADHFVLDDPAESLRNWLPVAIYADAMDALGMEAIIDL